MKNKLISMWYLLLIPCSSFASSTYTLPPFMQKPADTLVNFLTSGVGVVIIICGIASGGVILGIAGLGEGFKKLAGWILGGSIIMGAGSLVAFVFGATLK